MHSKWGNHLRELVHAIITGVLIANLISFAAVWAAFHLSRAKKPSEMEWNHIGTMLLVIFFAVMGLIAAGVKAPILGSLVSR